MVAEDRPERDPEPDRGSRAPARRIAADSTGRRARLRHHRCGAPARDGVAHRGARSRVGSDHSPGYLVGGLRQAGRPNPSASHDVGVCQHAPLGRARGAPA